MAFCLSEVILGCYFLRLNGVKNVEKSKLIFYNFFEMHFVSNTYLLRSFCESVCDLWFVFLSHIYVPLFLAGMYCTVLLESAQRLISSKNSVHKNKREDIFFSVQDLSLTSPVEQLVSNQKFLISSTQQPQSRIYMKLSSYRQLEKEYL